MVRMTIEPVWVEKFVYIVAKEGGIVSDLMPGLFA